MGFSVGVRWGTFASEIKQVLVVDFKSTTFGRLAGVVGYNYAQFVVQSAFQDHGCPTAQACGVSGDGGRSVGSVKGAGQPDSSRDAVFLESNGSVVCHHTSGTAEAGEMDSWVPLVSIIKVAPVQSDFCHSNNVQLQVNDGLDDAVALVLGVVR